MVEPQEQSTHSSGGNREREKPSGFWQTHETHKKKADNNHESNRMARPISGSVSPEGDNFGRMRKVVGRVLGNAMMNIHRR